MSEQGRGRDTGRERISSRLQTLNAEPDTGLEPKNYYIDDDKLIRPNEPEVATTLGFRASLSVHWPQLEAQ